MSTGWDGLQSEGRAAPKALAYFDGEALGFHAQFPLPDVCLTCGREGTTERLAIKLVVKTDELAHALARASGAAAGARVAGKLALALPNCAACQARRRAVARTAAALRFWPLWAILAALLVRQVGAPSSVVLGALGAVAIAAIVLGFRQRGAAFDTHLVVEQVDDDGVVRVARVHADAGRAVLAAAGYVE